MPILERFGDYARFIVAGLVIAGTTLAWLLLGSVTNLVTTPYGRLFSLKLIAVAGLLSLAAVNRRRLVPRLRAQEAGAISALKRSIGSELVVVIVILMVTASFTTFTGPPSG
ncbi:CopD family protein [Modicisalibacter muralis]|uniref:CopD family protein n=1 Tax=Modicisalibacter muralis TaxID=119000 RepID=UPI00158778C7|nr:CopD family protein [Halomonas muralis]